MAKGCWADGHHAGVLWDASFPFIGSLVPPLPCQSHSCSSHLSTCLPAWPWSPGQPLFSALSQALAQRCHFISPGANGGIRRVQTAAGPAQSRCWISWLAPHGQDSHYLQTYSIPNLSIPHLVPPSLVGPIPPWALHPHQLFTGRSLWAHRDLGGPGFAHGPAKSPAPQSTQHLTAAPVCPGAAPTLLPGHSTALKTPTQSVLPEAQHTRHPPCPSHHSTLMHPPCPSLSQSSFGVYYGAAPQEQALEPLGQACADPGTGSG